MKSLNSNICVILVCFIVLLTLDTCEGTTKKCLKGRHLVGNKCILIDIPNTTPKYCPPGLQRFSENSEKCSPICDNCDHGRCIAPNICKCYKGFNLTATGRCVASCSPECLNGTCVGLNRCECPPKYSLVDGHICEPVCEPECKQGKCNAQNVCECFPGYEASKEAPHECLSICDFGDVNDDGPVDTDLCTCWDSYEVQDFTQGNKTVRRCRPKCDPDCVNGHCIEATNCRCLDGFQFRNNSQHICDPVCSAECKEHGKCVGPNQCRCDEGYINGITSNATCHPHCKSGCPNGLCINPNECSCSFGYTETADKTSCSPICLSGCPNGACTAPNSCTCNTGFKANADNQLCEPICETECVNGFCSTPNVCTCLAGYEMSNGQNSCYPECTGCELGTCIAPNKCLCPERSEFDTFLNTCKCNEGYELVNGICQFICINGEPAEDFTPNCSCWENFQHKTGSINECIPYCPTGCDGGVCIGPDTCECPPDRVLIKDIVSQSCQLNILIPKDNPSTTTSQPDKSSPVEKSTNKSLTPVDNSITSSQPNNDSFLIYDGSAPEDSSHITYNKTDLNHNMSLVAVAGHHIYLFYIIGIIVVGAISGIIILKMVHKKVDYSVDKSESTLGVHYNTQGSIMAY